MSDEAKTIDETTEAKTRTGKPVKEEIRLSVNPSDLLSKEGFALHIGKTVGAVVAMAKAGKLPAFYMADPLKPGSQAELWINRREWDDHAKQLVDTAPAAWHGWKDRINVSKPGKGRKHKVEAAA
ncbi:TPA: hypothetical protein PXM46_003861 [Yersinia enterocolitica]|nr:hypothetical protein [Yersinia enterocolitica]HDL7463734.1 hypothetical protein [Yersinia enterocolitica]